MNQTKNSVISLPYSLLSTLLGIITMGLFTTGKKWFREKYGGIRRKPPHYPGREFTSDQPFTFKIGNYRHGVFDYLKNEKFGLQQI